MGLNEVVNALERAEQLLEDGETGPAQDSLSWQRADDDADIQLGKACAMLGTCQQLRQGTNNYVSIVELSFNATERSFQFYLVEMTTAESADYINHEVCVYPQQITRLRKGSTDTTIQCFTDVISAIPTPSVGSRNYR